MDVFNHTKLKRLPMMDRIVHKTSQFNPLNQWYLSTILFWVHGYICHPVFISYPFYHYVLFFTSHVTVFLFYAQNTTISLAAPISLSSLKIHPLSSSVSLFVPVLPTNTQSSHIKKKNLNLWSNLLQFLPMKLLFHLLCLVYLHPKP